MLTEEPVTVTDTIDDRIAAEDAEVAAAEALAEAAHARAQRLRVEAAAPQHARRRWHTVVAVLAAFVTAAAVAAGGYMAWHHREAVRAQQQSAEFVAAARQIVLTLMSIDAAKADDSVQQILDNSTGDFREEFEAAADDFVKLAEDGKVVTDVKVTGAAVESRTADSATVLVTATSTVSNAAGGDKQPRTWRLSVDVVRDGDRLKMSKMEFVP